jgi:hypothetical protein
MNRLYIDGKEADLLSNDFTWNMQCADFFSFDTRQFSHSDVMYLPVTDNNREIFGLSDVIGIEGDGAHRSYRVDFHINGIEVISGGKGYLVGKQGGKYKFAFHEGIKGIYQTLNLYKVSDILERYKGEVEHVKTKEFIRESSHRYNAGERADVLYAQAYYGGALTGVYNYHYAPVAISVRWLFEKMEHLTGNRFVGNFLETEQFKTLYLLVSQVYHKSDSKEGRSAPESYEGDTIDCGNGDWGRFDYYESSKMKRESSPDRIDWGYLKLGRRDYEQRFSTVPERVPLEPNTFGRWTDFEIRLTLTNWRGNIEIYKNDTLVFNSIHMAEQNGRREIAHVERGLSQEDRMYVRCVYHIDDTERNFLAENIKVRFFNDSSIILSEMVSDLSALDFLKEIMIMFGLTPMRGREENVTHFYTVRERLRESPVLDWSDKFVRILSEDYHASSGSYGQKNWFRYKKYEEQNRNQKDCDTVVRIDDAYLSLEHTYESKFCGVVDISKRIDSRMDNFWYWEGESKEVIDNGVKRIEMTYKSKDNRFHIFNAVITNRRERVELTSEGGVADSFETEVVRTNAVGLSWGNLITTYYEGFFEMIERMRLYRCEMALSALDLYEFDFYKRIYVSQLGGYFVPNKITYKTGGMAEVELIKIR